MSTRCPGPVVRSQSPKGIITPLPVDLISLNMANLPREILKAPGLSWNRHWSHAETTGQSRNCSYCNRNSRFNASTNVMLLSSSELGRGVILGSARRRKRDAGLVHRSSRRTALSDELSMSKRHRRNRVACVVSKSSVDRDADCMLELVLSEASAAKSSLMKPDGSGSIFLMSWTRLINCSAWCVLAVVSSLFHRSLKGTAGVIFRK